MVCKPDAVYVLVTGDVDYSEHHEHADKLKIFDRIEKAARELDLKLSFYFTAREAVQVAPCVRNLDRAGHEIGCHGLIHNDDEEYNRMSYPRQFACISEATHILSEIIDSGICSFRAPRVKVSAHMYRVLAKLGYLTDSSVCSQRTDLISSNMVNPNWLFAPRMPYRPSLDNPFKRGTARVLIVPVSALFVPYISSVFYVFGYSFMKMLFRFLYAESRVTGKPIVYLYHPYEFIKEIPGKKCYNSNVRVHGLRFRRHFYRGTPEVKFAQNISFWKYMKSFPAVQFVTMKQFYHLWEQDRN